MAWEVADHGETQLIAMAMPILLSGNFRESRKRT